MGQMEDDVKYWSDYANAGANGPRIIDIPYELQRFLPMLHELDEEMKKRGNDVWELGLVMSRRAIKDAPRYEPDEVNKKAAKCCEPLDKQEIGRALDFCVGEWVDTKSVIEAIEALKAGVPRQAFKDHFEKCAEQAASLLPSIDFDALCREFPAPKTIDDEPPAC